MNEHGINATGAWTIYGTNMALVIFLIFLPFIVVISGILFFNIFLRKQITKHINPRPLIDQVYIEAEQTRGDDEDLGSAYVKMKEE
jgi:hypothetical protein